jgi:shikimate kinase
MLKKIQEKMVTTNEKMQILDRELEFENSKIDILELKNKLSESNSVNSRMFTAECKIKELRD